MSIYSVLLTLLYERIIEMDKNILNNIFSTGTFTELSAEELTKELDAELAKPNPDYDLVDELTAAILEAREMPVSEVDVEAEIAMIKQNGNERKRTFRCPKWAAVAAAACVMLLLANTVTYATLDMSIFSVGIEFVRGGFSVDFVQQKPIYLPTSEDDPYGVKGKLSQNSISFEIPHYIPNGFRLMEIDENEIEDYVNTVRFVFRNGNQSISFDYEAYFFDMPNNLMPSDDRDTIETEVNGSPAIISKEDEQYTVTYVKGKTYFQMFTQNISYDEFEKIVASLAL